jgi:hypothetical protein
MREAWSNERPGVAAGWRVLAFLARRSAASESFKQHVDPMAKFANICLPLLGVLILSACSPDTGTVTYMKKSGDLIQFMEQEVRKYDGTPATKQPKPVLQAGWQYAEDKEGFQILLSRDKKAALVEALTEAFGEPLLRDKYPQLVYKEDRFGVGVVADLESDPIHIICMRRGAVMRFLEGK